MTYVPLGVRTEYSFLDSLCRIPSLVERSRALRLEALGVADLHSTLALPRFDLVARQNGLRPLLGARVRLLPEVAGRGPWGSASPEMALFATDQRGYGNLLRLVSLAHLERGQEEPGVTLADLEDSSAGLLALDGGLEGPLCRTLMQGNPDQAMQLAARLRETFGAAHFFVQIQRHGGREEAAIEAHLLHLARSLNISLVAANDTRYLDAEEARQYEVLRAYAEARSLSDPVRAPLRPRQHLRSDMEMTHLFRDLPEALGNTRLVAEHCDFRLDLGTPKAPEFETPTGRTPQKELQRLCERGACTRYGVERYQELTASTRERIAHELAIIEEKKLASCFLLVQDVVRTAKEEGIPAGPGRGSLTGSLVAFALGITQIDPVEHGLLFERFTSRGAQVLPDFELHVGHRGRETLVSHLRRKLGAAQVVQLGVVERFSSAGAVRAAADVVGLTESEREEVQPLLRVLQSGGRQGTLRSADRRAATRWATSPKVQSFLEVSMRLEGLAHHLAPSPRNLMLGSEALTQWVSLQRSATGQINAQATHEDADILGFMRLDLDGSRHLTQQAETAAFARSRSKTPLQLESLPLDDEPTYRALARGETLGVPQLETTRMQGLLRALQPARFDDLVTLLSPGRAWIGAETTQAPERKSAPDESGALDRRLDEILRPTRGWLLFEEQVAQIAQRLAAFDPESAEAFRAAIARSDWREIGRSRPRFLSGVLESGLALKDGEALFSRLVAAAGRLASQSHVTGDALLAYRGAYLSTHHPLAFMAAALNSSVGQRQRCEALLRAAVERHLFLRCVDINRSKARCTIEEDAIRLGLLLVRQVGETLSERIVEERERGGPFDSLADFSSRLPEVPSRSVRELVLAGVFESVGVQRDKPAKGGVELRRATRPQDRSQLHFSFEDGPRAEGEGVMTIDPPPEQIVQRGPVQVSRRATGRVPDPESRARRDAPFPRLWVVGRIQGSGRVSRNESQRAKEQTPAGSLRVAEERRAGGAGSKQSIRVK